MFPNRTVPQNLNCIYILQQKEQGFTKHYAHLVDNIRNGKRLLKWYPDLSTCVTLIKPEFYELLEAVFSFNWDTEEAIVTVYIDFLVHLNAANGHTFILQTFNNIVLNFKSFESFQKISPNLHLAIRKILKTLPESHTILSTLISSHYPHLSAELDVQHTYLTNILEVLSYCPLLRGRLIHCIIDKFIQIDVEIKLDEIPDEDQENGGDFVEWQLLGMEIEEEALLQGKGRRNQHIENASKLDVSIDLLIEYLKSRSEEEQDELFTILLKVFDNLILLTHQSKYTQFIIFFMCQLKHDYTHQFVSMLLNKLRDPCAELTKQSAIAYLGSFIGRANFVTPHITQQVMGDLSSWLQSYLDTYSHSLPDCERHGTFYWVVQSLFYIFCFKNHQFEAMPAGTQFPHLLEIPRIVHSKLNPLKFILPTVVKEFSKLCGELGVADLQPILQNNSLIHSKTSYSDNRLDSFFPFDPFLLKQSSHHFKDSYTFWKADEEVETDKEEEEDHRRTPEQEVVEEWSSPQTGPEKEVYEEWSSPNTGLEQEQEVVEDWSSPRTGLDIPQLEYGVSFDESTSLSTSDFGAGQFMVQDISEDRGVELCERRHGDGVMWNLR